MDAQPIPSNALDLCSGRDEKKVKLLTKVELLPPTLSDSFSTLISHWLHKGFCSLTEDINILGAWYTQLF